MNPPKRTRRRPVVYEATKAGKKFTPTGEPILTLTNADAAADLAGTPRPDHPSAEVSQ